MRRLRSTKAYHWLEDNPVTGVLVAAGLGAAAILLVVSLGLYSKETFVSKTACTRNPASPACAKIREAVARAEPLRNPCIGYQRVTRTRGKACPQDFIDLRESSGRDSPVNYRSEEKESGLKHAPAAEEPSEPGSPAAPQPPASSEASPVPTAPAPVGTDPGAVTPAEPADKPGLVSSALERVGRAADAIVCSTGELLRGPCG